MAGSNFVDFTTLRSPQIFPPSTGRPASSVPIILSDIPHACTGSRSQIHILEQKSPLGHKRLSL